MIKGVTKTVWSEVNEQKQGFLGMQAATLCASLLENMLAEKGVLKVGKGTIRTGRAGWGHN